MHLERPIWRTARLAAGIALASALVAPLAGAVIRASGGARSGRTVVDGVDLVVRSPALPDAGFVASKPGDSLQGAAAVSEEPYREFSVYAYPFGSSAPSEGIEIVEPRHLRAYRSTGAGRLIPSLHVPARIFGHRIEGSVRVVDIGLGLHHQQTEVVSWLTDAGNRLWIIRAAQPFRPSLRSEGALDGRNLGRGRQPCDADDGAERPAVHARAFVTGCSACGAGGDQHG